MIQGAAGGIPGTGLLPVAGRVITAGTGGGAEEYLRGGTPGQVFNAAAGYALGAGIGEAVMGAIGTAGAKAFTALSDVDKASNVAAFKVLAEQKPRIMQADGTTIENTAYTAAKKTVEKAGIDPERAAYGYNAAVKNPQTAGEAFAQRPGKIEERRVGAELDKIEQKVGALTPAATPAKMQQIASSIESPTKTLSTQGGKVPLTLQGVAEEAARTMNPPGKPAQNFGELVRNFGQARSDLLKMQAETELAILRNPAAGLSKEKEGYRIMGDHVRAQQEKVIRGLLPPKQADALMQHWKNLDTRYYNAVKAGGVNGDIVDTIAKGGAEGVNAKAAFKALAGNDPTAERVVNALVAAKSRLGSSVAGPKSALSILAAGTGALHFAFGPVASSALGVITAVKLGQTVKDFMAQKAAGKMVTLKDLVMRDMQPVKTGLRQTGTLTGEAAGGNVARRTVRPTAPAPAP